MIRDQEYRDIARRILDHNICVEAGAGTGKTTLLTDRLLFLLMAGGRKAQGVDISRVVALTFTEKAAGEIKVRLSGRLNDIISVIDSRSLPADRQQAAVDWLMEAKQHFGRSPDQIRQIAEKALSGMDRAHIGTIHHFAATLLKLYPIQSEVDPNFDVDTGQRFNELFETEWARWLDVELGIKPPRASQWLEILPWISLADLSALARAVSRDSMAHFDPNDSSHFLSKLRDLQLQFSLIPSGKPDPGGNSKIFDSFPVVSNHIDELVQCLEKPRAKIPSKPASDLKKEKSRKWPKAWEGLEGESLYNEALSIASSTSPFSEALIRKAVAIVQPFAESFRHTYAQKGYVSFDGLLLKARDLVKTNLEVRQDLKARFDTLLIDEFQDTDPLQGEIILFLCEHLNSQAEQWQDIHFEPGKIFVVGDPKQSIYRFRGANISAYEKFMNQIGHQGGMRCNLQTNFRSVEKIVNPVNSVFSVLMQEKAGLQPRYVPIWTKPEKGSPMHMQNFQYVLVREEDESGNGDKKEGKTRETQKAEASWIAQWITDNCTLQGKNPDMVRQKPYFFRDVAVLLRTTSPLPVYLNALKEAQIPYIVESDRFFYGTQEVIDFVNLLRVLDNPDDKISLVGLLRSPLVGLDDKEIYELHQSGEITYLQEVPEGVNISEVCCRRIKTFYAFLRRFRARVGKDPLGELVGSFLKESFLIELCSFAYHQEQTAANLMKFGRMAEEAGNQHGTTLKEFIQFLTDSINESVDEGENPLADENLDAVRILTIHKSKGLEYPVVFLPNLSGTNSVKKRREKVIRQDWEDGSVGLRLPQMNVANLDMAYIEQSEENRESAETIRLLYVAMTRAKDILFLMGRARGGDKTSFSSLLAKAGAWPAKDDFPQQLSMPDGCQISVTYTDMSNAELTNKFVPALSKSPSVDMKAVAEQWKNRYKIYNDVQSCLVFSSPTQFMQEEEKSIFVAENEKQVATVASLVGQVCHQVLEDWDYRKVDDLSDRISRAYRILKQRYPIAYWSPVARESEKVLEEFLSSELAIRLAKCDILGREIPFLYEKDGAIIRGSIDMLYRKQGKLWVADYKTDKVTQQEASEYAKRYQKQGQLYVEAVEKSIGERCNFQVIFLRIGEAADVDTTL